MNYIKKLIILYYRKKHFRRIRQFHKDQSKLPYEEKVRQVIELQKIEIETRKATGREIPEWMKVWEID